MIQSLATYFYMEVLLILYPHKYPINTFILLTGSYLHTRASVGYISAIWRVFCVIPNLIVLFYIYIFTQGYCLYIAYQLLFHLTQKLLLYKATCMHPISTPTSYLCTSRFTCHHSWHPDGQLRRPQFIPSTGLFLLPSQPLSPSIPLFSHFGMEPRWQDTRNLRGIYAEAVEKLRGNRVLY